MQVSHLGWMAWIFYWLRSAYSKVEDLRLSCCNIDDEGAVAILTALSKSPTVKRLQLAGNRSITSAGWIKCFQLLLDSELCLYALSVGSNNIDDQAAEMLMTFLAAHKSLKTLDLTASWLITSAAWIVFFRSLMDTGSTVEDLVLC